MGSFRNNEETSEFGKWLEKWSELGERGPPISEQRELARKLCLEAASFDDNENLSNHGCVVSDARNSKTSTSESQLPHQHQLHHQKQSQKTLEDNENFVSIVSWKGVSVDWFKGTLMKLPEMERFLEFGCEMWFVRNVCITEMLRNRGITLGSLVDNIDAITKHRNHNQENEHAVEASVESISESNGKAAAVNNATAFLSYTGSYSLRHFSELLSQLQGRYVWMDVVCVDQFAWTERSDDEILAVKERFMDDLRLQIGRIGYTALMLEKWDDLMTTLGQIWVIWEIFSTVAGGAEKGDENKDNKHHDDEEEAASGEGEGHANDGSALHILLSNREAIRFAEEGLGTPEGFERIRKSLAQVEAKNARAWNAHDKKLILGLMKKVDGIFNVNQRVVACMQDWLVGMGRRYREVCRADQETFAHVSSNLGVLFQELGRYSEAEPLQEEGLAIYREHGADHGVKISLLIGMARLYASQGRLSESEKLCREALDAAEDNSGDEIRRGTDKLAALSNLAVALGLQGNNVEAESLLLKVVGEFGHMDWQNDKNTLSLMNDLAYQMFTLGKLTEAEDMFRKVIDAKRNLLGGKHPETLGSLRSWATVLREQGRLDESAELCLEISQSMCEQLGYIHPELQSTLNTLVITFRKQGRLNKAEELCRKTHDNCLHVLGEAHQYTNAALHNLANILFQQGKLDEAEALFHKVLEFFTNGPLGTDHPHALAATGSYANLLAQKGDIKKAERMYRAAIAGQKRRLGSTHQETLNNINNLSALLLKSGHLADAEPMFALVLTGFREKHGTSHPSTLTSIHNLGLVKMRLGKWSESELLLREALCGRRQVLGEVHIETRNSMSVLVALLLHVDKQKETEELYFEVLEARRASLGSEHVYTFEVMSSLADFLRSSGRGSKAVPLYKELLRFFEKHDGKYSDGAMAVTNNLAHQLHKDGNLSEAEPLRREVLHHRRQKLGNDNKETLTAMNNLAALLYDNNNQAEADSLAAESLKITRKMQMKATIWAAMKFALILLVVCFILWRLDGLGGGLLNRLLRWQ